MSENGYITVWGAIVLFGGYIGLLAIGLAWVVNLWNKEDA